MSNASVKVEEWVRNATDQEIIDVIKTSEPPEAIAVWTAIGKVDEDLIIRIHPHTAMRMVGLIKSEKFEAYRSHEEMLPDHAKAELVPASEPATGSLVETSDGVALCIDDKDPHFPACLKDGEVKSIPNFKMAQYYWVQPPPPPPKNPWEWRKNLLKIVQDRTKGES